MGREVDLVPEIGLIIFPDVVSKESYGNDKRDKFIVIGTDHLEKFLLFIRAELFLEITHHVLEHVGMLLDRGEQARSLHEQEFIAGIDLVYL